MTTVAMRRLAAAMILILGCARDGHTNAPRRAAPAAAMTGTRAAGMPEGATGPDAMVPNDARFIDAMIPHHQAAIDMANDALDKGEHAEVRELAQRIITAQRAEIDQLAAWRQAWYPALASTGGMAMPLVNESRASPAEPYDRRFIDAMIPHHQSGIVMAIRAREEAEHVEIKQFSEQMVTSQQAEIDQMKEWRAKWYVD